MGTKRKSRKKHARSSKLDSKLYAILSGKTHRVVARAKKLTTARRRAAGLVKRGSKHVSIRRGAETFAIGAAKRTSRKRRSKRSSKRRSSKRRSSKRRSSKRGVRRNSRRRRSRRRVSRNSRRRHSRRRVSRNSRRRRHSRRR